MFLEECLGQRKTFESQKVCFSVNGKQDQIILFGISWVKYHKLLGYTFGFNFSEDDIYIWSKLFLKFDQTLNLWRNRQLSLKGKSTILNSLCLNRILYYSTANLVPSNYSVLFQRSMFSLCRTQNTNL